MWRDVYDRVLHLFYQIFVSLEDQGTLNPGNEVHHYTVHRIFLPQIRKHLETFRAAWNFHGFRTERNQSPQQLRTRYREPTTVLELVEVILSFNTCIPLLKFIYISSISCSCIYLPCAMTFETTVK